MALIAQLVDVGYVQQSSVLRAVWCVAGHASFGSYSSVLVDKGSARLCMALRADGILISRRLDVVVSECSMCVMAVAALHDAFIHLVVEGHVKCRLDLCMAPKAKSRLRSLQQGGFRSRGMDAVAAEAAYVCLGMGRAEKVRVGASVTTQAGRIHFLRRHLVQTPDLRNIATGINVSFAGAVATFAGRPCPTMLERELGMRIAGHPGRFGSVAKCTRIVADEVSRILHRLARQVLHRLGRRYAGTACGQNPGQCNG
jgi:hypothetical protein